jgi:FkbM family methyltransferase
MVRRRFRDLARSRHGASTPAVGPSAAQPAGSPSATGPSEDRERDDLATEADIEAAFRLLLGRPTDPDGASYWKAKLGSLTVAALASSVMDSREFRAGPLCRHLLETGPNGSDQPRRSQLVEAQGLQFWVDPTDYISRRIIETGMYERHVTIPLIEVLSPGDTFVDVGANIGWHSMLAARAVGPQGRVVSFEPDPDNLDLLLRSAGVNHFDHVTGVPVALSDQEGSAVMQRLGGSDAAMFAADDMVGIGDRRVSCLPLDHFASWVTRVDVMKVDVEGADFRVLEGGEGLISQHRPVIFLEFSPDGMARFDPDTPAKMAEWLRHHGYRLDVLHRDAPIEEGSTVDAVRAGLEAEGVSYADLRLVPEER